MINSMDNGAEQRTMVIACGQSRFSRGLTRTITMAVFRMDRVSEARKLSSKVYDLG